MKFLNIKDAGVMSIDRFANILIDNGLAGQNIEGGGIETVKPFVLVTNKKAGKGIQFPAGLRIRRVDG